METSSPDNSPSRSRERRSRNSRLVQDGREEMVNAFERDFSCIAADDSRHREDAYRLRYEVYCVENKYEDPGKHPEALEVDEFDSHAPHKLLLHRPTGAIAGVVRLVLPIAEARDRGLPVMRLTDMKKLESLLPSACTAEVSRFAISRRFRESVQSTFRDSGAQAGGSPSSLLCHMSLGLMRAVVELSAEHGMTRLCAVMEPALLRLLARLGVHFHALGPKVDYHGWRQPCWADLDRLLARTWSERRDVWNILTHRGTVWPLGSYAGRSDSDMLRIQLPA